MTNRLAQSQSLYLRKHAENPIDWWPWSDEALTAARTQNKPIFLSVGYSSCHWCTVMEGEAFSNPEIAKYMNANFIPIKVDREERPDLDSIYMQALQMIAGQGGWPLNVFLTPDDLVPFYGGTYFPVEPRYGRPGFLRVLQEIRRYYDGETEKLSSVKAAILANLQQAAVLQTDGGVKLNLTDKNLLEHGLAHNTGVLTAESSTNQFPMMPYADMALRGTQLTLDTRYDAKEVCTQRGVNLALGGIYDHVGGGFHRYTVDPTWTVPHFEKMLYDNGQIVEYLANLWSAGVREPAFERAVAGTVDWLKREMTAPEGYFYAAQDADSFNNSAEAEPEEGAFYVWSYSELEELLTPAELTQLKEQFTITLGGNFEGKTVLQRRHLGQLSDSVETALAKLFVARYGAPQSAVTTFSPARNNQEAKTGNWVGRIPPVTDTKMIVAWNSLMISGLARAYAVYKQPEYLSLAVKAADFIVNNQWVEGRFHRLNYDGQPAVLAQSEDYALFIKALLDLHGASPQTSKWIETVLPIQEELDELFWSVELGGYYNTAEDASGDLLVRERSYVDNATPSANGVAVSNLIRLALLTENLSYLARAEQALQAFSSVMQQSPVACPGLFTALDWYQYCTLVRTTADQLESLLTQYLPSAVLVESADLPDSAVGLVCQGLTCLEPAFSVDQLREQIQQSLSR